MQHRVRFTSVLHPEINLLESVSCYNKRLLGCESHMGWYCPLGWAQYFRFSGSKSPLVDGSPAPLRNVGECLLVDTAPHPIGCWYASLPLWEPTSSHSECCVGWVWAAVHTTVTHGRFTYFFPMLWRHIQGDVCCVLWLCYGCTLFSCGTSLHTSLLAVAVKVSAILPRRFERSKK